MDSEVEDTVAAEDVAPVAEAAEADTQEPASKRRRFPWRRTKSAETADSVGEAAPAPVEAPDTTAAVGVSDAASGNGIRR